MCEFCDNIKEVFNSDLSDEEKVQAAKDEAIKELICDYLEDNEDVGIPFSKYGLTMEDIEKAPKYELDEDDFKIGKDEFCKKKFSNIETVYLYDSNAYGSKGYGPNSRRFCVSVAKKSRSTFFQYRDILRLNGMNPGLGQEGSNSYSIFLYRGGKNCKHFWTRLYLDGETGKIVKAPSSLQPKQIDKGSVGGAPE